MTPSASELFDRLRNVINASTPVYETLDRYFDGQQHLKQLGLAIPPELERFTVIVNWPRVVGESRVDRLDMKGFRVGDDERTAEWAWGTWLDNCPAFDQSSYLDFEVFGRCFRVVDKDDDGNAVIETVSPIDITVHRDPVTGVIDAALRRYRDGDGMDYQRAVAWRMWLPDRTITIDADNMIVRSEPNESGIVPVVPAYRNPRTTIPIHKPWPRLRGTSAIADVIELTDACARDLTNAQVAQETHAVPQRGVLGATKGDFVDENGDPLTTWEAYFGRIWALKNKDAKTFEFSSSSMENFERMVELYARLVSGVTGLPPNYFGLAADDAASADAIRSREAKLVKSIERDQRTLGVQAVETMRLVALMEGDDTKAERLNDAEALWHDPGTPTVAQRADAVTKLYATSDPNGRPLMPRVMAWEELGWGPAKIARAEQLLRDEEEAQMGLLMKPEVPYAGDDGGTGGAGIGDTGVTRPAQPQQPSGEVPASTVATVRRQ